MTANLWQHKFGDMACPPCVFHSFLRQEHTPDHRYPLLDDSMSFPSITFGQASQRWFITTACACGASLRERSFRTQGQARKAWRGTVKRLLADA